LNGFGKTPLNTLGLVKEIPNQGDTSSLESIFDAHDLNIRILIIIVVCLGHELIVIIKYVECEVESQCCWSKKDTIICLRL
jgi:hypothetical protein